MTLENHRIAEISWYDGYDQRAAREWDAFVSATPRGHYCQLSTWLASYGAYGFHHGFLIARGNDGAIIGGAGALLLGTRWFRVMTVPIGPIIASGWEASAQQILEKLCARARECGCIAFQLQPLASISTDVSMLLPALDTRRMNRGAPFGTGLAPATMKWIVFPATTDDAEWRRQMFARFSNRAVRNIKTAEKRGIELIQATSEADVRSAYAQIETNGREHGYATRSWQDFGATLLAQVSRDQALVLLARYDGRPCGGHYAVIAGQRLSYMMGGAMRMKPDLKVGYLLHWTAMITARARGLLGYDLTSSGPPSVVEFKSFFSPTEIVLDRAVHEIIAPLRFQLLRRSFPILRRNKARVAAALSSVRRTIVQ